jgi:Nucleotidyl transferase AbiEii toxin, Type IV TA system
MGIGRSLVRQHSRISSPAKLKHCWKDVVRGVCHRLYHSQTKANPGIIRKLPTEPTNSRNERHFWASDLQGLGIRENAAYEGIRVTIKARLGEACIPLQIDIGFGDVVTPKAKDAVFPPLLDFPAPHLQMYPKETVIAEKFEAMAKLGLVNSRMKDYYDIWTLSQTFEFDAEL